MRNRCLVFICLALALSTAGITSTTVQPNWPTLERQFAQMPMEARRLTCPLFWLHGDESKDRLETFLGKLTEGHDGAFCAESRPHNDWLGPRWFSDLDICLQYAKKNDLKMWIFDEKWWPSQTIAGKVPPQYAAKRLETSSESVTGPRTVTVAMTGNLVAVIAGKPADNGIDPNSLLDLTPLVRDGSLTWDAPAGNWQIMKFAWTQAPNAAQGGKVITDGASQDCVNWFLNTVYQPHYDRFKDDFGKTIVGFFYDEPETQGDWGTELSKTFAERDVDWKKALVAWKFGLAGDEQVAAKYAYIDALGETWGRTMYGSTLKWCEDRGVQFIGHFMEHDGLYLNHGVGAINLFQMQKYNSMGGIDLVCQQLYPGQRRHGIYQLPKLASSISHAYHKADDLAMCEIFGAYGQGITYPQMKWLLDQQQVRGVNFMIPHSFNPRAPRDTDCPPYFYNEGEDARWPLYRVWADYSNRLSTLLSGGRHVCPIAFLFCGNSVHVGKTVTPEDMTSTIQDARYDCDWLPYEVFEGNARVAKEISLYDERYQVLIVPPVEAIPYETLAKVKRFFDAGGVVVGYDFLPSRSASLGHSSDEIKALVDAIWGPAQPSLRVCRTSAAGGHSYFLPAKINPTEFGQVLAKDAGIPPVVQVVGGNTDNWLHVLHRQKSGQDVFLICNQRHDGPAKEFRLRLRAKGEPECWDAMRNEITTPHYQRVGPDAVEMRLTLEPSESVLVVFQPTKIARPARLGPSDKPMRTIPVTASPSGAAAPETGLSGCSWVWFPEGNPRVDAPAATRWFRKEFDIPANAKISQASLAISADNTYAVYVNGALAGKSSNDPSGWREPGSVQITNLLKSGRNVIAIAASNLPVNGDNPAGLIGCCSVELRGAPAVLVRIDGTWKTSDREERGWNTAGFDDSKWANARELAQFGEGPWMGLAGAIPPANPFVGKCVLPRSADPKKHRVYLDMDALQEGASVTVNGRYAGGIIGAPLRLDVTNLLRTGSNDIRIEPYAPSSAQLLVY